MIITDNYILKATINGKRWAYQYDTNDVWTALEEFWHEDYPETLSHMDEAGQFPIEVHAMDNGKVIKTYQFIFNCAIFHAFYDHGHITLNEFKDQITKDNLRSVWLRLGVTVTGTAEDIEKLFDGDKEMLLSLIERKQYELDGNAYIPDLSVESYNDVYGTDYAGEIEFEL